MQVNRKWLLIPPALALVLFLGPLRSPASASAPQTPPAGAAPGGTTPPAAVGPALVGEGAGARPAAKGLPATPALWPLGSALLGVLLLGAAGLAVWRRVGRAAAGGERLISLRQSLVLSNRHRVHVLQFDDRVLLVGASDGHLVVLDGAADSQAAHDERRLARRAHEVATEVDEGAVPRDMVLPARAPARPQPERNVAVRNVAVRNGNLAAEFKKLLRRATGVTAT